MSPVTAFAWILLGSGVNPVWSPDGRYLLYTTGYENVYLFLWDSTRKQSTLLYGGSFVSNDTSAWSADSRSIIFAALTTNGNYSIFQLPVAECLVQSPDCIPHELTAIPAFYRNPHWKPQ